MSENNRIENSSIIKNHQINVIALIKKIWNEKKVIYYCIAICFILGLLIAFLSPKRYAASSTILPSGSDGSGSSFGNISSLANLAGISMSNFSDKTTISTDAYPQIINSYPFLDEFIHCKFTFEDVDQKMTLLNFIKSDTIISFSDQILRYTIFLPMTIKTWLFKPQKIYSDNVDMFKDDGVLSLSTDEDRAINSIKDIFNLEIDDKTNLITISVETRDPLLSAQYVNTVVDLLQRYIINYKTQKAREYLDYVQDRYNEKKKDYVSVQKEFFEYKDSHRNVMPERIDPEYQKLSDNYDIISSIYKNLAQQLEQCKLSVKENAPVFSIIEPVRVPKMKSSPKSFVIIVISIFLGVFVGLSIILGKVIFIAVKAKFEE